MTNREKRGYILLPDEISSRPDLTANQKLILGLLGRFQKYETHCVSTYKIISDMLGMDRRQVIRDIKRMPEEDLRVWKSPREKGKDRNPPNMYIVTWALKRARRGAHARLDAEKDGKLLRFPSNPDAG